MRKPLFCAVHNEGTYPTQQQALASTGADGNLIALSIAASNNDAVMLDFGPYSALSTPSSDGSGWVLWRAFTNKTSPKKAEVRAFIKRFPKALRDDGKWAIFEYTPGLATVH